MDDLYAVRNLIEVCRCRPLTQDEYAEFMNVLEEGYDKGAFVSLCDELIPYENIIFRARTGPSIPIPRGIKHTKDYIEGFKQGYHQRKYEEEKQNAERTID